MEIKEKITKDFSLEDFCCKGEGCCGNSSPMNPEFLFRLQKLQDSSGGKLKVSSGFRCKKHNASEEMRLQGSSKNSPHSYGIAADVSSDTCSPKTLAEKARILGFFVIEHSTFIHVDLRDLYG